MYQKDYELIQNGIQKRVCPKCGHDLHEAGATKCMACQRVFSVVGSGSVENRNLRLVKKKTRSQKQRTKSESKPKRPWLLVGGIALLLGGGVLAYQVQVNASPEAALKRIRGDVYFGGEPCAQGMMKEEMAQAIQKLNNRLKFVYYQDGSGDQIDALIKGKIDIAFSEKMFLEEHYQRAQKMGVEITAMPYALDAVVFFTNKKNPIRPLTVEEIKGMVEGRITNWSELGGKDQKIIPVLMAGDTVNPMGFVPKRLNPNKKLIYSERAAAKKYVEDNEGAFFYTSGTLMVNELNKFNPVSIKKDDGKIVSAVIDKGLTNQVAIRSGEYPLRRQVVIIVRKKDLEKSRDFNFLSSHKAVRPFAKFLLSGKGQEIVKKAQFVPRQEVKSSNSSRFSFF